MTTPHTRAQAAEAGLTKYHGNPCKRCKTTLKWTLSGACVLCQASWLRDSRAKLRIAINLKKGK